MKKYENENKTQNERDKYNNNKKGSYHQTNSNSEKKVDIYRI